MMNGSPRPRAPAAAVVAASGRVRPRPNRKARPMTSPPTNRRVAPQNRRESSQLLVDQRRREGHFDGPVGPLAAADGSQTPPPRRYSGPHHLARRQLGEPRRNRRAHQPRLVAQARHDDALAVPDGRRPTVRQALALQQRTQVLGHEAKAHDEADLVAASDRYRDVVDRLPHHQAGEEIGDHGAGRLPHPLQRSRIARHRRRLAVGHVGVDDLAARRYRSAPDRPCRAGCPSPAHRKPANPPPPARWRSTGSPGWRSGDRCRDRCRRSGPPGPARCAG